MVSEQRDKALTKALSRCIDIGVGKSLKTDIKIHKYIFNSKWIDLNVEPKSF